ncbi:hypothetical protein HispidOSU_015078, partial [Sigmodon hispidus]
RKQLTAQCELTCSSSFSPTRTLLPPPPSGVLLKDFSYLSSGSGLDSQGQSSLECV